MAVPRFNPPASSPQRYQLPPAAYGPRPAAYGTPPAAYGTRPTAYGTPPAAYGTRPTAYGTPPAAYGTPSTTYGTPPAAYGTRPVARIPAPTNQLRSPRPTNFGVAANAQLGNRQPLPQPRIASAGPQTGNSGSLPAVNQKLAGSYNTYDAYNAQAVNGSTCGAAGCGPGGCINCSGQTSGGYGFFFRYDRLYLSISAPDGGIGSRNVGGFYTSNGIDYPYQNGMGSGFIGDDFEFAGDRIEFGFLDGDGSCGSGWIASIIDADQDHFASQSAVMILFDDPFGTLLGFQDADGDGYDDDQNGDMVYGRDGQDLGTSDGMGGYIPPFDGIPDVSAAQDDGDLITFQPVFNEVEVSSYTEVSGLALSRFFIPQQYAGCGRGGTCVRMLWGVRYLDIDERFSLVGSGSFFDEIRVRGDAHNFIIGPEIGFCLGRSQGPWSFGGELRFVPGVNVYNTNQTGVIGSNAVAQSSTNQPLNLVSTAFSSRDEHEAFSAIVEWRAEVAYSCTNWFSLRAGYTGIFVSDVARGSDINYSLPDFGISGDRSDVYINALTLGAELVY